MAATPLVYSVPGGAYHPRRRAILLLDIDNLAGHPIDICNLVTRELIAAGAVCAPAQVGGFAFYVPRHPPVMADSTKEALRRMGIAIVECAKRKEDADREIAVQMGILRRYGLPEHDVVAVVSSDQDMIPGMRDLGTAGFMVWSFGFPEAEGHQRNLARGASPGCARNLSGLAGHCPLCYNASHRTSKCVYLSFKCKFCDFNANISSSGVRHPALDHMIQAHGADPAAGAEGALYALSLDYCQRCFRLGLRHERCLEPEELRPCPVCQGFVGDLPALQRHALAYHQAELPAAARHAYEQRAAHPELAVPRCADCLQYALEGHICPPADSAHHCPVCAAPCPSAAGLEAHLAAAHSIAGAPPNGAVALRMRGYIVPLRHLQCPVCLQLPHRGGCPPALGPHCCPRCATVFPDRPFLAEHLRECAAPWPGTAEPAKTTLCRLCLQPYAPEAHRCPASRPKGHRCPMQGCAFGPEDLFAVRRHLKNVHGADWHAFPDIWEFLKKRDFELVWPEGTTDAQKDAAERS